MSIAKPFYHVAPVAGRQTVFANVEYREDTPPSAILIGEHLYVRNRAYESATEDMRKRMVKKLKSMS